jgi:hypothetical protein
LKHKNCLSKVLHHPVSHFGRAIGPSALRGYGFIQAAWRSCRSALYLSPYARPIQIAQIKCVVIDTRLHELDPRALDFVLNFAKDNDLAIEEACEFEPKSQTHT